MTPDGKYYDFLTENIEFTYSDGKVYLDQQKKEGVWTVTTSTENWMWHNVEKKFVLNTSDIGAAQNNFPSQLFVRLSEVLRLKAQMCIHHSRYLYQKLFS